MKMERALYLNGKPLVKPPLTMEEQLNERLNGTGYKFDDIVRMNERPTLQIIDLDGLTSGYLNNNELFQMLKQQIMDWNEKVTLHRAGQMELQEAYVHDNLYRSLRSQLQEVANSRNRQQQSQFLNKVANWFFRQLPKTQSEKLTSSLLEKRDSTLHFIPTEYNENMYQSGVQDYAQKCRSMYPEINPPEDRVKQYQRKNLLSDTSTRPGTTPGMMGLGFSSFTRPQTSQTTYKMVEQIDKVSRPRTNQQTQSVIKQQSSWMYDTNHPVFETFEEQQKSTRRQVVRQESPLKADRPSDRDKLEQIEGIEQEQEQDEDEDLSPDKAGQSQKNLDSQQDVSPTKKKKKDSKNKYISIAPDKRTYKTDKDTEQAYQVGQKERLGEFQGTFHHYDPTGIEDKMAVARLNQYYSQQRIKELKEQREDIEMIQSMKDWANNKGRIDEMIYQSGYLSTFGSQFSNVGIKMSDIYESKKMDLAEEKAYTNYLKQTSIPKSRMVQSAAPITKIIDNVVMPTQIEEEVEDFQQKQAYLELKINSQRLMDLKKSRGSWLPGGIAQNPNQETIQNNRIMSSSCFKNPPVQRQFSAVFKTHSIKQEADKQINEIHLLKNRLASENKFVPINVLQKSIVIPQGHLNPYKVPLPKPGILLADIPDISRKRAKKKKSKK